MQDNNKPLDWFNLSELDSKSKYQAPILTEIKLLDESVKGQDPWSEPDFPPG